MPVQGILAPRRGARDGRSNKSRSFDRIRQQVCNVLTVAASILALEMVLAGSYAAMRPHGTDGAGSTSANSSTKFLAAVASVASHAEVEKAAEVREPVGNSAGLQGEITATAPDAQANSAPKVFAFPDGTAGGLVKVRQEPAANTVAKPSVVEKHTPQRVDHEPAGLKVITPGAGNDAPVALANVESSRSEPKAPTFAFPKGTVGETAEQKHEETEKVNAELEARRRKEMALEPKGLIIVAPGAVAELVVDPSKAAVAESGKSAHDITVVTPGEIDELPAAVAPAASNTCASRPAPAKPSDSMTVRFAKQGAPAWPAAAGQVGNASTGGMYGTSLTFAASPSAAEKQAAQQQKLVFLLHVSGDFDDPGFT
ncbi:MAG TPA: hypothetical protein VKS79_18605 [Gemmataceae bacterium]|nr:hypothetical protein [Gemmataceae bacterium]